MTTISSVDMVNIYFLTWSQTFAYLAGIGLLCKMLYVTINKLCSKLSLISRAGYCVMLIVTPALLAATCILAWEFILLPAQDIKDIYLKFIAS